MKFILQICILQGTRSGIERCLELIQEKIPLHENPDFDMKQINEPTNETDLLHNQINEGLLVQLPGIVWIFPRQYHIGASQLF